MWEMYLPRHNCTVTGTQGVRYCGFPIAMKAWMGTSASLSHVCRTSVGRTESLKGKLCKGSSVGSGGYRAVGTAGSYGETVKAVGRERNHLGRLRTGRDARGGYGFDSWGGNRPKHSFYGDFRGTRTVTLFQHGFWTERREKEPRERKIDRKEREMAERLIGVSDMAAVESCKVGCILSDGSRCAYYGIRRVQSVGPCASHRKETVGLVCTDGSCVLMERDDCGTLGGYDSDRVSAFCTGYGIEPSVEGSVMTGPRLVLTGYGAVEPSMY
ncbi:hypothetical protein F2Q68_00008826 [Brassica cretica]|uniref:Uncharacterized protein n=1 Tax=Brassica cretica TaxID=69181 RepID=A0A8S9KYD0_BRACR|nr:hypothetical protein F2Q68_00008826 [Brassica cretica]